MEGVEARALEHVGQHDNTTLWIQIQAVVLHTTGMVDFASGSCED